MVALLNSRQLSPTEVPMRLIGLAVILAVSLTLTPPAADAQQPGKKLPRIGYLSAKLGNTPSLAL